MKIKFTKRELYMIYGDIYSSNVGYKADKIVQNIKKKIYKRLKKL